METVRRLAENKIAESRGRIKSTLDRSEPSLIRRELIGEIAMLRELDDDPDAVRERQRLRRCDNQAALNRTSGAEWLSAFFLIGLIYLAALSGFFIMI